MKSVGFMGLLRFVRNDIFVKQICCLIIIILITGCSSSGTHDGGALAIKVSGAKSFNPWIDHGHIQKYRVTVSGEGIGQPITAEFPGDATEGVVEGIPSGEDRFISVEAINDNDAIIRAGERGDVEVGGGLSEVEVALEAVPIFTNIADGNAIDNTRLVFKIFGDPSHPVNVQEERGGSAKLLVDAAINAAEILLDESSGLGRMAPALIEPGLSSFTVKDVVTGRATTVSAVLLDGTKAKAAPLVSATKVSARASACSAPSCDAPISIYR
ncbi:MAG: hypothetical protein WC956_09035 [bacterium]